ncbi:hypothetical protein B0H14DRAFT_2558914 [Mycena olivaceomarginata]|nr:hypothetical protein B0H14DRAFT_2558914 [Mycena olivaceomarginata]
MLHKFFLTIAVVLLVLGQGTEAVPQAYRTPCDSVSQLTPPIFTCVGLPQRRDLLQTPDVSVPHWHRLISKTGFVVEEADIGVAFYVPEWRTDAGFTLFEWEFCFAEKEDDRFHTAPRPIPPRTEMR